jgi:rhodanese-related sulfurtransferase
MANREQAELPGLSPVPIPRVDGMFWFQRPFATQRNGARLIGGSSSPGLQSQKEISMTLDGRPDNGDIDPTFASQLVANAEALLIDVREDDEWAAGHAPEATHMALGRLSPEGVAGDQVVITVCRSGVRSAWAAAQLQAAGLHARNLTGGMKAWSAAGLPVCRDDGSPGTVV